MDGIARGLQVNKLLETQNLLCLWSADAHSSNDLRFFGSRGIANNHLHEETVALGFGKRVDAFALDGVLCCENQERLRNLLRYARNRDLMLGHDFEKCRLHLGRSAVDFIGKHDVGEHRTPLNIEWFRSTSGRYACR